MSAASEEDFRAWEGWCHSRFRQLVMLLQSQARAASLCTTLYSPAPACHSVTDIPASAQGALLASPCCQTRCATARETPIANFNRKPAADKRSSLNPNLCGGAGDCAALAEDAARAAAGGRRAAARLLLLPGSQEEAGALTDPAFTHRAGQSLRTEQQEQQPGSGMHTSHINIHERCSPKNKCKCFEKLYCIACAPVAHRVLR